ncbi:MAG: nucleotidyl transferase AbiEii/AbiGii toxin family protein [Actinobacteria bacterium]|uniref:Unannotated protein n=1 Tax=freshwater metagenome TaxID=449393 RepID=A0A6J7R9Z3_9ZZZZ|nr:nucleotidyl transferase AbiEii/AbiGii toxin family protein [Actinomycetota bacterium]MSW42768.1 nucleotidyl transferase AbiEii/AbiGii toxin family protein [Actinomycetota bacterium]
MSSGEEVFFQLQRLARSHAARNGTQAPTSEYVTRHGLESFLDRLMRTEHGGDFVLKGGMLLGVYGARRPTRDIDAEAVNTSLTPEHIAQVVRDVAAVMVNDGVNFDLNSITVTEIREAAQYPGWRMRVAASLGSQRIVIAWDISTGDPVVPPPRRVSVPRVLGDPIEMLGYAPETTVAEKGVTILERGKSSTRWRDYVDIVQLAAAGIDDQLLLESMRAVARYRNVTLGPIAQVVAGYGDIAQAKWAAWRHKEGLEDVADALLDDQLAKVAAVLDPVLAALEAGAD